MATGVLPVMLSGATRFIEFLETHEKAYTAGVKLGVTTDTLDVTGTVTSTQEPHVRREELERTLKSFTRPDNAGPADVFGRPQRRANASTSWPAAV